MPSKSDREIEEIQQQLYAVVWPLVSDFENTHWKLKSGKDKETTGLVYKGKHDEIGTVWKMEVILDIDVHQFAEAFYKNQDYDWMPNLKEWRQLEVIDDGISEWSWYVEYTHSLGRGYFLDRDFVSINFHQRLLNGWTFDMTTATEHPNDPLTPNCVRGEQLPSGSLVRPLPSDPKRCELIWMHNMDMKGMLPRTVINLIMSTVLTDFATAFIEKCKKMAAAAEHSRQAGGK